jgi:hypothetical protein
MMWRTNQFRSMLAVVLLITGFPASTSHAVTAVPPSPPTFNEKDLFAFRAKGRGGATGQVFLRAPSGKAVTQAGVSVYLIPAVPHTRYWFDKYVRVHFCSSKGEASPSDALMVQGSAGECPRAVMAQLLNEKRLLPYLRATRANPTGHFWFTKLPAGRYYIVSLLDGAGNAHQDERAVGMTWLTIELDPDEKATNLVVTDCKSSLC